MEEVSVLKPLKIDALLFDLGGVVFEIDFEKALEVWKEWTTLPIEDVRSLFGMDDAYEKHERGEIHAQEYFNHLRKVLELEANDFEIAKGWNAIYLDEISETVDYIERVRNRLPCYAFTNSNPTHQEFWESTYTRAVGCFDKVFISSDIGFRKPEKRAFEAVSADTGIDLSRFLFFDDTEENVVGAREAGMHAVHVKSHSDVRQALKRAGVL